VKFEYVASNLKFLNHTLAHSLAFYSVRKGCRLALAVPHSLFLLEATGSHWLAPAWLLHTLGPPTVDPPRWHCPLLLKLDKHTLGFERPDAEVGSTMGGESCDREDWLGLGTIFMRASSGWALTSHIGCC
jgi:hypothetical protein